MRKVPTICWGERAVAAAYLEEEDLLWLFAFIAIWEVVFDGGVILELHDGYVFDGDLLAGKVP